MMSLSKLMSSMDLSLYPQIALVIFLAVFAGVLVRLFSRKHAEEYEKASRLPLDD
ncbi:MAG: cbb3-type cytochrome c oxidase subunit 3 [Myxococcota bacterium]